MADIKVRLRNPSIVLMPVTEEEAEEINQDAFLKSKLYVLYELEGFPDIEIGMLADYAVKYCPSLANVSRIDEATSFCYFFSGGTSLEEKAELVQDRPVYLVYPSDDRKVAHFESINGKEIDLNVIVNGPFIVGDGSKTTMQLIKNR